MTIPIERITSYSLLKSFCGDDIRKILVEAINSVDAGDAIKSHVTHNANHIMVGSVDYDLSKFNRIFIIGAGKACIPMIGAISEILQGRITAGVVITKEGYLGSDCDRIPSQIKIVEANHPVPDQRNLDAGNNVVTLTNEIKNDDLVICLLSGGGSYLLMYPYPGISLQEIQATTNILLHCGASIDEMNTIRKHVDIFKAAASASAHARPRPREPTVTTATFTTSPPARSSGSGSRPRRGRLRTR